MFKIAAFILKEGAQSSHWKGFIRWSQQTLRSQWIPSCDATVCILWLLVGKRTAWSCSVTYWILFSSPAKQFQGQRRKRNWEQLLSSFCNIKFNLHRMDYPDRHKKLSRNYIGNCTSCIFSLHSTHFAQRIFKHSLLINRKQIVNKMPKIA